MKIIEGARIIGHGVAELWDKGECVQRIPFKNIITEAGDRIYGERAGGVSGAPSAPSGMHLGSGSTVAAKTGAGAAIGTYLTGSNVAFVATYPSSSLVSGSRRITYRSAWGPGVAQVANIREIALVNKAIGTNSAALAAETISRIVLGANLDKSSGTATLYVTLRHDFLGA